MDNLLKLVMAKTKDGITDDAENKENPTAVPYYKAQDTIDHEEFIVETVTPKIKILRHASTNTDLKFTDIPNLNEGFNCKKVKKELEDLMRFPIEKWNKEEMFSKMENLSNCMSKFVDSTNALSKLTKDMDSKCTVNLNSRNNTNIDLFSLGIGELVFILLFFLIFALKALISLLKKSKTITKYRGQS